MKINKTLHFFVVERGLQRYGERKIDIKKRIQEGQVDQANKTHRTQKTLRKDTK